MTSKAIAKALKAKMDQWVASVDDAAVKRAIKDGAIITGGCIVSLLQGSPPNDYDVYFKDADSLVTVARYYVDKWNGNDQHTHKVHILDGTKSHSITADFAEHYEDGRVKLFVQSAGVASEDNGREVDMEHDFWRNDDVLLGAEPLPDDGYTGYSGECSKTEDKKGDKFRPVFISNNAITLSDKVQIVVRFFGNVDTIHKNYDFVHATCSYDYKTGNVVLPSRALEAIINRRLWYIGSKYPVCSILRMKKFIQRGWTISAGDILKMLFQVSLLDLTDVNVLEEQTQGVDSMYFAKAMRAMSEAHSAASGDGDFQVTQEYLFEILDRIFS